jgi:uncharacterized protein YcfL
MKSLRRSNARLSASALTPSRFRSPSFATAVLASSTLCASLTASAPPVLATSSSRSASSRVRMRSEAG